MSRLSWIPIHLIRAVATCLVLTALVVSLARWPARVVLPTPPLREAIAMIFIVFRPTWAQVGQLSYEDG